MFEAVAGEKDVEGILALHTAKRAVWVGPLIIAAAGVLRGPEGAVAAAVGVGVVVIFFLAGGWILSQAARVSLGLYHAAALFGFFLRLALITISMLALAAAFDLDRPAFGVAAVVAYLVLLTLETLAVARGGERELDWIK